MFTIAMPTEFKVGDTSDCRINGEAKRLTWRDNDTLVIEPGDARPILSLDREDDMIHFICGRAGLGKEDYAWNGPILHEKKPSLRRC